MPIRFMVVCFAALCISSAVHAQEQAPKLPDYPKVDLANSYEVDPSWPTRPQGVEWAAVPGIAIDSKGQIWVHTRANPPIQLYDAKGNYIRGFGEDYVKSAHHLKIDSQDNVWVADVGNHVVLQFSPEGRLLRALGTNGEYGEDETHLKMPTDMAITKEGEVFVSDGYGNSRIVHFDKNGKFVKAWGSLGTKPGEFSCPHSIALDSKGLLYVGDRNNQRVQIFNQEGKFLDQWTGVVTPWGLWITPEDDVWICGSTPTAWRYSAAGEPLGCPPRDQAFFRFSTDGRLQELWTIPKGEDGKEKPGDLNWVHCLALDKDGNIYAGDIMGKRAQKFVRKPAGK